MKRNNGLRNFCFILFILFAVCPAHCSQFFVDPNGNDSGNGTIKHPFKTIPKAVSIANRCGN